MLKIIDDNENYVVCIKSFGISSEYDMPKLLSQEVGGEFYCVHRLDNAVGGIMVYARNKNTAASLSSQISERRLVKKYLAIVDGVFETKSGEMRDLLFKDSSKNKVYIVKRARKGVKEAILSYKVLDEYNGQSLVEITLITGRTHQIRVQFASRKHPLIGDRRYGSKIRSDNICLWSYSLTFTDCNGKTVNYTSLPTQNEYFNNFKIS